MQKITFRIADEIAKPIELSACISAYIISDPSEILELSNVIDAFVNKWSKNPFSLSGFIIRFMRSNRVKGWNPFVLVVKADEKIVGIAPLMMKNWLGMRFVQFFPADTYSPDFVVNNHYRDTVISYISKYLFKILNCQFARFCLPAESPNIETMKQHCRDDGIDFYSNIQSAHSIIPVECTWDEFQKKKGRRRITRQIECKLDQIGPWTIDYVEDAYNNREALEKILDVERRSWKARAPEVITITAEEILMSLDGSHIVAQTKTDFKCSAWFLRINSETVAYVLVIKHKDMAFIHKTSFDNKYRKFYVGKYVTNIAIADMFNEGRIRTIDFMATNSFMSFWTSLSLSRVEVLMWKGVSATLLKRAYSNNFALRTLEVVLGTLPNHYVSLEYWEWHKLLKKK